MCPLSLFAFGGDAATMSADNGFYNSQAQATTTCRSCACAINSIETLKDMGQINGFYAAARITDAYSQHLSFRHSLHTQLTSRGCIAPRVVEQVEQYLSDAITISQHRRCGWSNLVVYADTCLFAFPFDYGQRFINQAVHVEWCPV